MVVNVVIYFTYLKWLIFILTTTIIILGLDIFSNSLKHKWAIEHEHTQKEFLYRTNHYLGLQLTDLISSCANEESIRIHLTEYEWVLVKCKLLKSNVWQTRKRTK